MNDRQKLVLRVLSEMRPHEERSAEGIAQNLDGLEVVDIKDDLMALVSDGMLLYAEAHFVEGMGQPRPGLFSVTDKGKRALGL